MGTDSLMLLCFIFMTALAYMIAINARGIWRLTLSFLLATCMLGGTVWAVILQHSMTVKAAVQTDRRRLEAMEEQLHNREQSLARKEHMSNAARVSYLITQANGFAAMLQRERLQDPGYSHEQMVARATDTEQRLEALLTEINSYKALLSDFPDASKHLTEAMTELKEACRLYRVFYFAETEDVEQATGRNMRRRAKNAQDMLVKAEQSIGDNVD